MRVITKEQVMDDLVHRLSNFQGREYSGQITPKTLFFGDLGFVSIDAVVLWEHLQDHYGYQFAYQGFVEMLRQSEAVDVEVGQLADYLHQQLTTAQCEK